MTILATLLLSTVTVTLPARADVLGSEITLGEVAQIEGASAEQLTRLKALALGYAPSPGYTRVLQDWKIEALLRRQFADLEVKLAGSTAVRIFPEVATIKGSDIHDEARTALDTLFVGDDVRIDTQDEIQDELVPAGAQTRVLLARPALSTYASNPTRTGTWSIPVQIVIDGEPYRTVWVPFDVTIYRVMPVLKRDIPRGATIQQGDLVMRRTALRTHTNTAPLGERELLGATAGRNLSMHEPVHAMQVSRAKAVKKGELITLAIHNKTINVRAHVVALQDAYIGDMVVVQVMGSTKELTAKVVGKGNVELILGPQ